MNILTFQSELSRKQVKKALLKHRQFSPRAVSIRVIPEAGQEASRPAMTLTMTWCFNPSYPGSRSRSLGQPRFRTIVAQFQSELSRKQVKKRLGETLLDEEEEVSIRVIPEAGQEVPPSGQKPSLRAGFNPSYPGSRSRRPTSASNESENDHVSIRVIPEAGQEVTELLGLDTVPPEVSIRVIPEAGQEVQLSGIAALLS